MDAKDAHVDTKGASRPHLKAKADLLTDMVRDSADKRYGPGSEMDEN